MSRISFPTMTPPPPPSKQAPGVLNPPDLARANPPKIKFVTHADIMAEGKPDKKLTANNELATLHAT